ncbi:MAG: type I methionyl aminopeptidase [Chloroflexota bacterium]|nr:type I methionyl aminopeptidase [Chloroflexota bacterium]
MARTAGRTPAIVLKDARALEGMRRAGALVAETLATLRGRCVPGVTTAELDDLARRHIEGRGGIPSFLGYPGPTPFPGAICASVNEEVVHGLPGPRPLRDGDIIAIDVGVILDGWHGDAAITVPVGAVGEEALALIRDTEGALAAGIAAARPGNRLSDISAAIERYGRRRGRGIVRECTGHGIGREMHEEPDVPNFVVPGAGSGPVLRPGMTLAIEPIFTAGSAAIEPLADEWTLVTGDGSLAAHAEHTVAITARGPRVLTQAA